MKEGLVTVVIATYNRPDVLKMAVFSVQEQTEKDWILYVIGDNCDERTSKVMDEFDDPRIRYINLKDRFGEQSGPNSVGIALAKSKYIAFLNHDDIWLKDHLELALSVLEKKRFNFYLAGTANSAYIEREKQDLIIHVDKLNGKNRKPLDFFKQQVLSYEPASSWVVDTEFVKAIGYWNYYNEIYRVPIEDYILRAWRLGAKFYFSDTISVWYVLTQYQKTNHKNSYDYESKEHGVIKNILSFNSSNDIRKLLLDKHREWLNMEPTRKESLINQTTFGLNRTKELNFRDKFYLARIELYSKILFSSLNAYLYKFCGFDSFSIDSFFKGKQKGLQINSAILRRTGVSPTKPDKEMVIKRVLKEVHGV